MKRIIVMNDYLSKIELYIVLMMRNLSRSSSSANAVAIAKRVVSNAFGNVEIVPQYTQNWHGGYMKNSSLPPTYVPKGLVNGTPDEIAIGLQKYNDANFNGDNSTYWVFSTSNQAFHAFKISGSFPSDDDTQRLLNGNPISISVKAMNEYLAKLNK